MTRHGYDFLIDKIVANGFTLPQARTGQMFCSSEGSRMAEEFHPKNASSRSKLLIIWLVLMALGATAAWSIAAPNWVARSQALATLVVLGAVSAHLLTASAKSRFGK
jgi:hypothetical protein